MLLKTVKAPIRKEFGQVGLSNIEWGKGVCVGQRLITVIVGMARILPVILHNLSNYDAISS